MGGAEAREQSTSTTVVMSVDVEVKERCRWLMFKLIYYEFSGLFPLYIAYNLSRLYENQPAETWGR